MAKYRKADNCGPVPYPDRSGKFLDAGGVVEGDEWEPLVALGFVVKVEESKQAEVVRTVASAAVTPKAAPAPAPKAEEPKADILKEEAKGVTDDMQQANDGTGAEEVDSSAAGKSGDEGMSGRPASRRRR